MSERHFTEQQVADIIRRATDLQVKEGRQSSQSHGLITSSEVRRIASELGIDSAAIESAMHSTNNWTAIDEGNENQFERTFERTIEGDLPEEDYAAILEEFTPSSTPGSQSITLGSTLSYKSMVGFAECNVTVAKRNGRTSLRVKSAAHLSFLPTLLPALLVTLITTASLSKYSPIEVWMKVLMIAAVAITVWSVAFFAMKALVRSTNRKISQTMDRAAARIAELVTDEPQTSEITKGVEPLAERLQH